MHRAISRFTQVLHMGLSAILLPLRQILRHTNCRTCSGAEIKKSRLPHLRQYRAISNRKRGAWPPPSSHPQHPISWVLPSFLIEYTCSHHTIPYIARYIPQLGTRSFHTGSTHPPII